MTFETVEFDVREGYARLSLARPEVLNCFDATMHAEVRDALDAAASEPGCRALLLTGSGGAFCAGQDLSERRREPGDAAPDLGESLESNYNPLIRRLRSLPFPVVCAVNGTAAGAGVGIALAADIVIASRSAKFVMSFSRVGLVADCGGSWILPRLAGHAKASALLLLGESLSAEDADDLGLIYRCVNDDDLAAAAGNLCTTLATGPTAGLNLLREALRKTWSHSLDEQLDLERDLQREAGRTDDYREAVTAFLEKRDPKFSGR